MRLKSATIALSLSFVCLVPRVSLADTLQLESVTESNGTAIFPYNFSIDGSSTLTQLSCLNLNRKVSIGEEWNVNATNLASLTSSETIDGSSDIDLREDAFLDSLYNTSAASNYDIQLAIWDILDPSGLHNLNSISAGLVTEAESKAPTETSSFLSQFTLYTPVVPTGDTDPTNPHNWDNPSDWDGNGEPQQFLQYTPGTGQTQPPVTPEPSSLLLFGTGLLGTVAIMRRKLQHQEPQASNN